MSAREAAARAHERIAAETGSPRAARAALRTRSGALPAPPPDLIARARRHHAAGNTVRTKALCVLIGALPDIPTRKRG